MVKKLTKRKKDPREAGRIARRELRREQSREEILDAVKRVLVREGIAGVTLEAVAQEVELTKAALYYYFPSKDALLFEVMYENIEAEARAVRDAVAATDDGPGALAALIRAVITHYAPRLPAFRLCYLHGQVMGPPLLRLDGEMIERVRPLNELLYAGTQARLEEEQKRGRLRPGVNPRRLAFLAHMAAVGLLTMKGMVEDQGDPLVHKDEQLIAELGRAFGDAAVIR